MGRDPYRAGFVTRGRRVLAHLAAPLCAVAHWDCALKRGAGSRQEILCRPCYDYRAPSVGLPLPEATIMSSPSGDRPLCVVLDTNVWIQEHLLKTNVGKALVHAIARSGGKIALPEIVGLELLARAVGEGLDEKERAEKALRRVANFSGLPGLVPYGGLAEVSEERIRKAVTQRIDALSDHLITIEFSIEHARGALDRVIGKIPPNRAKEQFRDSVIWIAVLTLSDAHDVHFVTADKAFYKGSQYAEGIDPILAKECESTVGTVNLHRDASECLSHLEQSIPGVDENTLVLKIIESLGSEIEKPVSERNFALAVVTQKNIEAFPTELPEELVVGFEITYALSDLGPLSSPPEEERTNATAVVRGNCSYNTKKDSISEARWTRVWLRWQDASGEPREAVADGTSQRKTLLTGLIEAFEPVWFEGIEKA